MGECQVEGGGWESVYIGWREEDGKVCWVEDGDGRVCRVEGGRWESV